MTSLNTRAELTEFIQGIDDISFLKELVLALIAPTTKDIANLSTRYSQYYRLFALIAISQIENSAYRRGRKDAKEDILKNPLGTGGERR